jgi:TonB family protein
MTLWMLYAILFGTLGIGAGLGLERAAKALGLATRFVWLAIVAIALIGPLVFALADSSASPDERVELAQTAGAQVGAAVPISITTSFASRMLDATRSFDRALAWLWLVLSVTAVSRIVAGMVTLRRQQARWVAREIAGTECFVTPDIGPAVVAMPETRIILPEWALSLDSGSLATVVRHESQHFGARDAYLIVAGSLSVALMPWNPAIWVARRRLRLALEMDCDARVLAEDPRVDRYGSLLLAIAQRPRLAAGLAATLTESTSDLERRIDAMTARPPKHPRILAAVFSGAATIAIAFACSMPAPDMVGPRAADPLAKPIAPEGVFFDFQVEKPVSARPSNAPPVYPNQLRAANIEGSVIAKFVVDTNGTADMRTFEIVKSDHDAFSAAVREGTANLRFYPAQVGERKVKQLVQMPFSFSLAKGSGSGKPGMVGVGMTRSTSGTPKVRFDVPADETMPAFLDENAPPVYPAQLRAANFQGMVQATFVVREDGKVDMSTFIVRRSDHDAFTASVRKALETWRFKPATKDGKPVARMMQMPFMFSLVK